MKTEIGFIGLGAMGKPMSSNLIKKGYTLNVFDLRPEAVEELVKLGARPVDSPKNVAKLSKVIITMLPSSPHVEEVALGKGGIIEGIREGCTYIDMSTIAPSTTRKIGEVFSNKKVKMLDAPVARAVKAAIDGTLAIFVGGEKEVFDECNELLSCMGTDIYHMGELGSGEVVKIINNYILSVSIPVIAEGMVLGIKAGIKPEILFDALSLGSANSFALQHHFKNFVLRGDFREGLFPVDYTMKDIGLALQTGMELHVPLLLGSLANQIYESARAAGKSKNYFPVVITLLEDLTGVKVRNKQFFE